MKTTLFLLTGFFMFCSCEDELDIALSQKEKRIVINSFFNNEEYFHVNISSTQLSTDGDTVYFIDNARVLLYNNNVFLDTLLFETNGNYVSNKVLPEINMPYQLKVEVPGYTTATSDFAQIPVAVKDFSVDTFSHPVNVAGTKTWRLRIKFKDIENVDNYYLFYMIWSGTQYEYDPDSNIVDSVKSLLSYRWVQAPGIIIPYTGKLLFSDELSEGDTIEKNLYFTQNRGGPGLGQFNNLRAYFILYTISEEYYRYGKSSVDQNFSIDYSMFVEPVPVFTNINNGIGIFAGYGQCVDSVFYCE
jgi:hypothetical protein